MGLRQVNILLPKDHLWVYRDVKATLLLLASSLDQWASNPENIKNREETITHLTHFLYSELGKKVMETGTHPLSYAGWIAYLQLATSTSELIADHQVNLESLTAYMQYGDGLFNLLETRTFKEWEITWGDFMILFSGLNSAEEN
jgi:hypothetical protein